MSKSEIRAYLSKIGKIGGKKSRRTLSTEQARKMQMLSTKSRQLRQRKPTKENH
jgi:hypothetical protein